MTTLADASLAATLPSDPREAAIENYRRARQWLEPMDWSIHGHRLYLNESLCVSHPDYGSGRIAVLDDGSVGLHRPGGQSGEFLVIEHALSLYPDGSADTNSDPGFPPILISDEVIPWFDQAYPWPDDCSQKARDDHDALFLQAVSGSSEFWDCERIRTYPGIEVTDKCLAALDAIFRPITAAKLRQILNSCVSIDEPVPPDGSGGTAPPSLSGPQEILASGGPLADVERFLGRFVAYPNSSYLLAHALWIVHTHLMECWESTPRLAFLSPEPSSGKTRALEVSELLVARAVESMNASPSYLFRRLSDPEGLPTILYDEIDTVFGPRAKENEEVRGFLNAGHRRGAMAGRCVIRGKLIETEELPAFCAVAMAGIGNLPRTIESRSIIVPLNRRRPDEKVEPFRRRVHAPEGHQLRDAIAAWCDAIRLTLVHAQPQMPPGIEDRAADVWEPLLAVADAAGGDYPKRARQAAIAIVSAAKNESSSLGVRLLADIRQVIGKREWIPTDELIQLLCAMEESPWGDLRGRAVDARRLAGLLRQYAIHPKSFRSGTSVLRGYARADLEDAWSRYLPPSSA